MSNATAGLDATRAWEGRALDRSLAAAKERSSVRARKLVSAARKLAADEGSAAFTIADVAEQAGVSLRSFYRQFAGKDELLLALFEEEALIGAELLIDAVGDVADPVERLRRYVTGLFGLVETGSGYASLLVREHMQLGERRPDELRVALAPLLDLLDAQLRIAAAAGKIRPVDHHDAVVVFSLILAHVHAAMLFSPDEDATVASDRIWDFCRCALTADRATAAYKPGERR